MAGTLNTILGGKADLENGKLKTTQIPDGIGGITLSDVKSDTDIASALLLKHSNDTDHAAGSDNQDLSGFVVKETGKSLVSDTEIAKLSNTPIITVSATEPSNPVVGQIWIDIS